LTAHRVRIFVVLLIATAVSGCGRRPSSRSGPARQLKKSEMSVPELKYGIAPVPDPSVTYQPDVIVVGGGADAIRAQNSNGFIWTIDGNAPHAAELVPGKIFFLTSRAVGRVLDVRKDGSNLIVTVGPVDIVEVVRDANIHIDMPIDFGEAIAYSSPDLPGQSTPVDSLSAAVVTDADGPTIRPAAFAGSSARRSESDAPRLLQTADTKGIPLHFKVVPVARSSGVGLHATSQVPGLIMSADAAVHLATPRLNVDLQIQNGGVKVATLELSGAAGLTMKFEAGTDVGMSANVHEMFQPDTDFSIPVYGLGPVPLAVTVRQVYLIKTAFGVRNTTMSATGDYTFTGSFKAGYVGGKWGLFGPTGFSAKKSLLESTTGMSLGHSGLVMAHQMKVIAGIGVHGFAAGPYFAFTSSVGITRASDIGMLTCRQATLDVNLGAGVGYLIPKAVTDAINFVLRQLNIKYRVDGEGGFSTKPPLKIISTTGAAPQSEACAGKEAR
jgi:hypothetical protein